MTTLFPLIRKGFSDCSHVVTSFPLTTRALYKEVGGVTTPDYVTTFLERLFDQYGHVGQGRTVPVKQLERMFVVDSIETVRG